MKIIKVNHYGEIPLNFTGIIQCFSDGIKRYYVNGKLHRLEGAAAEYPNGLKVYYINDKKVTKEAQELLYNLMKLKSLIK